MSLRNRVFTYITYEKKLLVFDHVDSPELNMQIPGGTIKDGELPAHAAIREAEEETGLSGLIVKSFLGDFEKDLAPLGRAETLHAWFYHLETKVKPPSRWRHAETDPHNQMDSILFELYWIDLDPKPNFGGIDDAKFDQLINSIYSNAD